MHFHPYEQNITALFLPIANLGSITDVRTTQLLQDKTLNDSIKLSEWYRPARQQGINNHM